MPCGICAPRRLTQFGWSSATTSADGSFGPQDGSLASANGVRMKIESTAPSRRRQTSDMTLLLRLGRQTSLARWRVGLRHREDGRGEDDVKEGWTKTGASPASR